MRQEIDPDLINTVPINKIAVLRANPKKRSAGAMCVNGHDSVVP